MLQAHSELVGPNQMPVEEIKIEEEQQQNGKKRRKKRNMEKYAPLIFEECYVRHKNFGQVKNSFSLGS